MNETETGSLRYFMADAREPRWGGFLRVLSDELNDQMNVEEIRAFFYVLGKRLAEQSPLGNAESLEDLETGANAYFRQIGWGWMRVRDVQTSLELVHACAPLRSAFGDEGMAWAGALLEGLYSAWLHEIGAGDELTLRQIGDAEGAVDTLRFRLAHPSLFV